MTQICLDTSAYSHFRRNHVEASREIRRAARVLIPVIALGELRAGFRIGKLAAENEATLAAFLREPVVRILDADEEAASIYAEMFAELRRKGKPLPTNDLWIAALASREGASVLTFDQHFRDVPRVGSIILTA